MPDIFILKSFQESIIDVQDVISSISKVRIPMIKSLPIIARITLVDIILTRLKVVGISYLIVYWI